MFVCVFTRVNMYGAMYIQGLCIFMYVRVCILRTLRGQKVSALSKNRPKCPNICMFAHEKKAPRAFRISGTLILMMILFSRYCTVDNPQHFLLERNKILAKLCYCCVIYTFTVNISIYKHCLYIYNGWGNQSWTTFCRLTAVTAGELWALRRKNPIGRGPNDGVIVAVGISRPLLLWRSLAAKYSFRAHCRTITYKYLPGPQQ